MKALITLGYSHFHNIYCAAQLLQYLSLCVTKTILLMKQLLLIITLFCMFSPLLASKITLVDTSATPVLSKPSFVAIPNNSAIKQLLGRKLTLKEKLGLLFVIAKYKKGIPVDEIEAKKANTNAILGFAFSMLGIFIFPLFAIPAYVLCDNMLRKEKKQPGLLSPTNKTLAQIGKITAIVTGIIVVIALIVVFYLLTGFR